MLEFDHVTIDVPNKNKRYKKKRVRLVDNACGSVGEGELLAVMGPSGCGKSTLIQALAGRIQTNSHTTGSITYNGKDRELREWVSNVGFADQDDTIFEESSVYQTLWYAAKFKLKNISNAEIEDKINAIMKKLNITHVYHNKMKKLSGGERKRVMLGVEMIKDVKIMFFDEPTSGLDTKTALQIIKTLKQCAKNNKIVIITIHQPCLEIFEQFDKLMLMSDTKTIYFGKASECEEFLSQKGIKKDEKTPIPDFISQITAVPTDEEDKNDNTKYIAELAKDFENLHPKKSDAIIQKTNQMQRDYRINLSHSWCIFTRLLFIKFGQKMKIAKKIILMLLTNGIIWLINVVINLDYEKKASDTATNNYYSPEYKKFILNLYQMDNIYTFAICIFICVGCSTVMLGSMYLFDNNKIIKREIRCGHYTSASYFIGLFFYNLLWAYGVALYIFSLYAGFGLKRFNMNIYLVLLIYPVIGLLSGMAYGYIFQNGRAASFMAVFIVIAFIANQYAKAAIERLYMEKISLKVYKVLRYPTAMLYLLPSKICSYIFLDSIANDIKKLMRENCAFIDKGFTFYFGYFSANHLLYTLHPVKSYMIAIIVATMIFFFSFSIFNQARSTDSEIRLRLQKKNE